MRLRSHGALLSSSSRRLQHQQHLPINTSTMATFSGTVDLASSAMRAARAALSTATIPNRSITPRAESIVPRSKLWSPIRGIVFDTSPASTSANTPRPLSMASSAPAAEATDVIVSSDIGEVEVVDGIVESKTLQECEDPKGKEQQDGQDPKNKEQQDGKDPKGKDKKVREQEHKLPLSSASFQMTPALFKQAKNALPESPESYWSYALYRGPARADAPRVKVHYCRSKHATERTMQYFVDKPVLGFDIEWVFDFRRTSQNPKKNVSLIQLACEDRIALFHIALFAKDGIDDLVAPTLKKVMEDPAVRKVGVAIKGDCTRLRKWLGINARGIFELSHLYKLVAYSRSKEYELINKKLVNLALQVEEHLHLPLFKGKVRSSDWSQPLQMDQIIYAASDSYAGFHLVDTLDLQRRALDPTPPLPYNAEDNKPIHFIQGIEMTTSADASEDADDAAALEPSTAPVVYSPDSASYLASATSTLVVDGDDEAPTNPSTQTSPPKKPLSASKPPPKSPLILAATTRSANYRAQHPTHRPTPSALRTYFLWQHNETLSVTDVAALLRDPPLATSTVVNYILDAVHLEHLPFDPPRLRTVLAYVSPDIVANKYGVLQKMCQQDEETGPR